MRAQPLPRAAVDGTEEAEFASPPPNPGPMTVKDGPKRLDPPHNLGSAEIKPHTLAGIRAGLNQLVGHETPSDKRKLITYLLYNHGQVGNQDTLPRRVDNPDRCRVFVLFPRTGTPVPQEAPPTVGDRGRHQYRATRMKSKTDEQRWLGSLGDWFQLKPDLDLSQLKMSASEWYPAVGPVAFGSMLEPILRDRFLRFYGATRRGPIKHPHRAGADVTWQELERYYAELASESAG